MVPLGSLAEGGILRVNYADRNGWPYRAIGKLLVERGILPAGQTSMQQIRAYLKEHPQELREIFSYNPSYVFFRTVAEGPIGSIGTKLTRNRSIATDHMLFPRGALALIQTEKPVFDEDGKIARWEKFTRFVLNQDTGGAIRGPGRVDLFTGFGNEAEQVAGNMKQEGTFYFVVKRGGDKNLSTQP